VHRLALALLCALALAGCGEREKPARPTPQADPVERFVRYYQDVGFFAGEDPERAAERITKYYRRRWGEDPDVNTQFGVVELLSYDRDRVWFADIERDAIEGNDEYVHTLRQWARISEGDFAPRELEERWASERGPVDISFTLDGGRESVTADGKDDFLDLCILDDLNALIADTGRRFEVYNQDLGQDAFIVALTAKERALLEQRGWTFATPCH
jgi:hypothetical protein